MSWTDTFADITGTITGAYNSVMTTKAESQAITSRNTSIDQLAEQIANSNIVKSGAKNWLLIAGGVGALILGIFVFTKKRRK